MRDAESFDAFYAARVRRVTGQVYLMTGSRSEADDWVPEAYARAWQRWGRARPRHLIAIGFADRTHSSFDATGRWVLYLSGTDLFISRNGRRPTLLTSGLIAAAWIPPGRS